MVRSIEAMGSSSGKTRQRIVIADCGELPSRRQILAKMAAEKEALANMKKDPIQVHIYLLMTPSQASRRKKDPCRHDEDPSRCMVVCAMTLPSCSRANRKGAFQSSSRSGC